MPVKAHKASDYLKTPEEIAAYLNAHGPWRANAIRGWIRSPKSPPLVALSSIFPRNG